MTPETSVAQTTKQKMLVVNACCCHLCVQKNIGLKSKPNGQAGRQRKDFPALLLYLVQCIVCVLLRCNVCAYWS
jgi:hypothetical protein